MFQTDIKTTSDDLIGQLGTTTIYEVDSEKDETMMQKYESYEDISKQYKYGYSAEPVDKQPFEIAARCYYCSASFSIEAQVKNFLCSNRVLNGTQGQNVKMITKNCPCKKSIPGCAVCLAPIGMMNYQVELLRTKNL